VLHAHRVLNTAMERAIKWRLLSVNPVAGVEAPHVPEKEQEFLTADESERLVAALVDQDYELPILVGLYCGLRPTEYLALRWQSVDLEAGELRVTQNVHRTRVDQVSEHMGQQIVGFRFGPAKTHRSKRLDALRLPSRPERHRAGDHRSSCRISRRCAGDHGP
jgi:integrase